MPSSEYMRNEVAAMYPYKGWKRKVKKMTESQVMAIYFKNVNQPKAKPEAIQDPKPPDDIPF